ALLVHDEQMHRRAKTISDLVSTGRLDRFRCHAMPRYGAARRHLRRRDSDSRIDQVTCGVAVRQARWVEIGPLIEADVLASGLQPDGLEGWPLRHPFAWACHCGCRQRADRPDVSARNSCAACPAVMTPLCSALCGAPAIDCPRAPAAAAYCFC